MIRRAHLWIGIAALAAFLATGAYMRYRTPPVQADVHMMYVSRHIYILGAALANLMLGLYFADSSSTRRRGIQRAGSMLLVLAPFLLVLAFIAEPEGGIAGRSWRSSLGLYAMFGGAMLHVAAKRRVS